MQIEMQRYNIYANEMHFADFVVASEHIPALLDDYWVARMEDVVEIVLEMNGRPDTISIFDKKFNVDPEQYDFCEDAVQAFVYTPND